MTETPSRHDLFRQAGGVGHQDEYLRLCREHGIAPDGPPGVLPGSSGLPGPVEWPDHPPVGADAAAAGPEEPHHAAARQSTREEREAAHVSYLRRERRRVQGGSR